MAIKHSFIDAGCCGHYSLYGHDANSAQARTMGNALKVPVAITPLQRHELRNAFRLALFRQVMTLERCQAVLDEVEVDTKTGELLETPVSWAEVYAEAEALSAAHTKTLGTRGFEYKGKHKDLAAAYDQLLRYRNALENPPLLVVCGLDPAKRSQLGAHFTGREDIELVVDAVIMTVLRREWNECTGVIHNLLTTGRKTPAAAAAPAQPMNAAATKKARGEAGSILHRFLDRLQRVRILDPACGSGNFLYVALLRLKDLEKEVILVALTCAATGLKRPAPISPPAKASVPDYWQRKPYVAARTVMF